MIEIKVPLKKFIEISGYENSIDQYIICDTSYASGIFEYCDILGLCRTKEHEVITSFEQANIILKLNNEIELIEAIKKYKPIDLWFS